VPNEEMTPTDRARRQVDGKGNYGGALSDTHLTRHALSEMPLYLTDTP